MAIAASKSNERLHFYEADLLARDETFDLLLAMDVMEHVPDYLGFLEGCRRSAQYKIYHIPLDVSALTVVRPQFSKIRAALGHLHFFTAETALDTLAASGHRVIDWFYTDAAGLVLQFKPRLKQRVLHLVRRSIASCSRAWAARLLGGYSMLVLAE